MPPFAERFAQRLFARYPEFAAHVQEEVRFPDRVHLRVSVPSPARADCCLGIVVCQDEIDSQIIPEIIVGFDAAHGHIQQRGSITEERCLALALEQIDKILTESVYIIVTERNGKLYRFGLHTAGTFPELIPEEQVRYTRSWLGTYNTNAGPTAQE